MSNITIEATVTTDAIREALEMENVLVFDDAEEAAAYLQDHGWLCFDEYSQGASDLCENLDADDLLEELRQSVDDSEILENLDPDTVGQFALDNDLAGTSLDEVSTAELTAELARRVETQRETVMDQNGQIQALRAELSTLREQVAKPEPEPAPEPQWGVGQHVALHDGTEGVITQRQDDGFFVLRAADVEMRVHGQEIARHAADPVA